MGRSGRALVFLLPHELAYVEFLRRRKVPLDEVEAALDMPGLLAAIRTEAESDRDVMEKATKAFVSFVRGYKEHHCRFIFRVADLDLGRLGMAFALLRMPRMPEIKHAAVALKHFTPSSVDPDSVKFANKKREGQRQRNLTAKRAAAQTAQNSKTASRQSAQTQPSSKKLPALKRRLLDEQNDTEELSRDYLLLRKLKRNRLTEGAYDALMGFPEQQR